MKKKPQNKNLFQFIYFSLSKHASDTGVILEKRTGKFDTLQCLETKLLVGIFRILIFLVSTTEITGKLIFLDVYNVQKCDKQTK